MTADVIKFPVVTRRPASDSNAALRKKLKQVRADYASACQYRLKLIEEISEIRRENRLLRWRLAAVAEVEAMRAGK
jgi:hypothetical protein